MDFSRIMSNDKSDTPILKIAVNVPLSQVFDYLPPKGGKTPSPGSRVALSFGRRQETGLVLALASESDVPADKLKHSNRLLDEAPLLSKDDLWLIRFTSDYYHHPIGEVASASMPGLLRQGKPLVPTISRVAVSDTAIGMGALSTRAPKQAELMTALLDAGGDGLCADELTELLPNWRRSAKALGEKGLIRSFEAESDEFDETTAAEGIAGPTLNDDQSRALGLLRRSDEFAAYLLDGVTGSGKTEVYLSRIKDMLDKDRQTLVLVPEIGLTPQLVSRLRQRLGIEPALLHSGLTDTARLAAWRAARSGAARRFGFQYPVQSTHR